MDSVDIAWAGIARACTLYISCHMTSTAFSSTSGTCGYFVRMFSRRGKPCTRAQDPNGTTSATGTATHKADWTISSFGDNALSRQNAIR